MSRHCLRSAFLLYLMQKGNICELHFTGEKQGDEHIFLKAQAPFVEKGSCLSFVLEEGILVEWTFDGNDVIYSEREEE